MTKYSQIYRAIKYARGSSAAEAERRPDWKELGLTDAIVNEARSRIEDRAREWCESAPGERPSKLGWAIRHIAGLASIWQTDDAGVQYARLLILAELVEELLQGDRVAQ